MQTMQTNNNDFDYEKVKRELSIILNQKDQFLAFLYLKAQSETITMVNNARSMNLTDSDSVHTIIENCKSSLTPYRFWEDFFNEFAGDYNNLAKTSFRDICFTRWQNIFGADNFDMNYLSNNLNDFYSNFSSSLPNLNFLEILDNDKSFVNDKKISSLIPYLEKIMSNISTQGQSKNLFENIFYRYGKADMDGSCFVHSVLAHMTQDDYEKIKDYVNNNNLICPYSIDKKTFLQTVMNHDSVNKEQVYYMRAAIAISMYNNNENIRNKQDFIIEIQTVLGMSMYDPQTQQFTCGWVGYFPYAALAISQILNRPVFIISPSMRNTPFSSTQGYIRTYQQNNNWTYEIFSLDTMRSTDNIAKHKRIISETIMNYEQNSIYVHFNGYNHYVPIAYNNGSTIVYDESLTDVGKFENNKQSKLQLPPKPLPQPKQTNQPQNQQKTTTPKPVIQDTNQTQQPILQTQTQQQKPKPQPKKPKKITTSPVVQISKTIEEKRKTRKELINLFYGEKVAEQIEFNDCEIVSLIIQQLDGFSKCVNSKCETIFGKIDDYVFNQSVTTNFAPSTAAYNNKIAEKQILTSNLPISQKSDAICFFTLFKKSNKFNEFDKVFFENPLNLKIMSLIFVASNIDTNLIKGIDTTTVFSSQKDFQNFINQISKNEKLMEFLYVNPECIFTLLNSYQNKSDFKHHIKHFESELQIITTDKKFMISLNLLVNEYLPVGCRIDFFNKFFSLDNSRKEFIFQLLNKYKPKYIVPVIYLIVNTNYFPEDNYLSQYINQIDMILDKNKELHMYFLNEIGIKTLKNNPKLSSIVNLLSKDKLDFCIKSIKQLNCDIDTFFSPLYDLSLPMINVVIEYSYKFNISPKKFIDIYKCDIKKLNLDIELISKNESIKKSLQIEEYKNLFLQNPNLFLKTFIETQKKLKEIEKTKENFSFLQTKEIKEIVEFAGYKNNETNQQKRSLNSLKQYCIAKSLNTMQDGEKLAIDISEAVKIANKELII